MSKVAGGPAVGVDMGTTCSCVAVFRHGQVQVMPNELGNRTTFACVAWTTDGEQPERLVGDTAKAQLARNPRNTVVHMRRLLGRRFDDAEIQRSIGQWLFTVVNDNGLPKVQVTDEHAAEKQFTPEELSAMVLKKMSEVASRHLGAEVTSVVIAVPAFFNDAQRDAAKRAGSIAGLNVLRIVDEPAAAAYAYGFEQKLKAGQHVLVFDLGGATFNVSVLTLRDDSTFGVKVSTCNPHLGGDDFDTRLVNVFADELKSKMSVDIAGNLRKTTRMRTACENVKKVLSVRTEATLELDGFVDGADFRSGITRARFEMLCDDLFRSTITSVEQVLRDAQMRANDISEIVLAGGSTRIPKLQQLLKDFFNGRELSVDLSPDEVVASGAAIQAAVLSGGRDGELLPRDAVPLSLGIETAGGLMAPVIPRNTKMPCKNTKSVTTYRDDQTGATIRVFEGERALVKDNHLLACFSLTDLPPAPKGTPRIAVLFEVDSDGLCSVSARDAVSGRHASTRIPNTGRLTKEEIIRMLEDAAWFRPDDDNTRKRLDTRHRLENYLYVARTALENGGSHRLFHDEVTKLNLKIVESHDWLRRNPEATLREVSQQIARFEKDCKHIMIKLHSRDEINPLEVLEHFSPLAEIDPLEVLKEFGRDNDSVL